MKNNIKIENLSDNPYFIENIQKWYISEWPEYYSSLEKGIALNELKACLSNTKFPVCFTATYNEKIVGTVTLKEKSASHFQFTPWLTSLYTSPNMRNNGIAKLLINRLTEHAKTLGYSEIYAISSKAAEYFENIGWRKIDTIVRDKEEFSIFKNVIVP